MSTVTITLISCGILFVLTILGLFYVIRIFRKNEMNLEKVEQVVSLGKWVLSSVLIVLLTTFISASFREREQDVSEMSVVDKYVSIVTKVDGVEEHWRLCNYLAIVSPKGPFRDSWINYREYVKAEYYAYQTLKRKHTELEVKAEKGDLSEVDINKMAEVEVKMEELNQKYSNPSVEEHIQKHRENEWYVVVAGDKTISGANYEIKKIETLGLNGTIFKKRDFYRSLVGPYEDKQAADEAVEKISESFKGKVLVINLAAWCSSMRFNGECLECN